MFKHTAAIGADIGRQSLRIAVVNIEGDIIAERSYSLGNDLTRDIIISILNESVREIRSCVASQGINPICLGIAAKGFIDYQSGTVLGPDRGIRDWTNVPLAKLISREAGLPVYVDNDANLMTIAEHRYGAARGFSSVVFVALRTGIGGGIIINGKLYRGLNNAGGEIGQMIINYTGGLSDNGIRGSFEYFASASALIRRYYEETGNLCDGSEKALLCRDIFELSYKGDKVAAKVVDENAELVGIGLANLISVFAPEMIVVGGGLSEADDRYLNKIKESALANTLENCRKHVKIQRAQLGHKGALLGGAFYGMNRLAGKDI